METGAAARVAAQARAGELVGPGLRPGEPTARMVQLWIEYDPHPPFGGIDWTQVDRDMAEPVVTQWVQTQLADRSDLLAKLSG